MLNKVRAIVKIRVCCVTIATKGNKGIGNKNVNINTVIS